ncbi:FCD domain-containing protein [uncultured Hoeflea sp.]|jgi:DNA-binding FadR family transcriptional regulator|uniref:FadR/GntR family transcriptional regulator n=1 Tax=uncultured Hoeflea sp. TaxID=538666 RepID=UPI0030D85339|tara:strand:+ start:2146 stop:2643 length:498 start_codon:yes stop_codon:yes gene_type:complete
MSVSKILQSVGAAAGTTDVGVILQRLTGASPMDVMNVRLIIEPQAAAAAVSNATGADIDAIRHAHDMAEAQDDLDGFEHWDGEFHRLIYSATRNDLLMSLEEILDVIRKRPQWLRIKHAHVTVARRQHYCRQHAEIVTNIANRNTNGAQEAMHQHLVSVLNGMFP